MKKYGYCHQNCSNHQEYCSCSHNGHFILFVTQAVAYTKIYARRDIDGLYLDCPRTSRQKGVLLTAVEVVWFRNENQEKSMNEIFFLKIYSVNILFLISNITGNFPKMFCWLKKNLVDHEITSNREFVVDKCFT